MYPKIWMSLAGLVVSLCTSACTSDSEDVVLSTDPSPASDAGGFDAGNPPPAANVSASKRQRLRFKGAERFRNDIAQALSLSPNEVCTELGQFDCVEFVHTITLGGVEPYVLGVNSPSENTNATTPLAVERVALAACANRVDKDLQAPNEAVLTSGLTFRDGKLDLGTPGPTSFVENLYRRSLLRNPTERELAHHLELYRAVEADGQDRPGRDWAVLSCFAVLTSEEGLFY